MPKHAKCDILVKIHFSCQLSKTLMNIDIKQHKKHHLILREVFP